MHNWSYYKLNPKSDKFCRKARTPKDYKDRKFKTKEGKGRKLEEANKNEKKVSFESKDSGSDSESSDKILYNSNTTEECNMIKGDKPTLTVLKRNTKSTEILIAVPDGVGGKKHSLYLCLEDTGTSLLLTNHKVVEPRSKLKKKISATY